MQIKDEFKIEGFQNVEKYFKINPVSIQITDPEIQSGYYFMWENINTDLLLIAFNLALHYIKIQTLYLLQQTD